MKYEVKAEFGFASRGLSPSRATTDLPYSKLIRLPESYARFRVR
jgi:hypothetical protein